MKLFFVAPLSAINSFTDTQSGGFLFKEWHTMPVDDSQPDGLHVIVAHFHDEDAISKWANTVGVHPLPHPMNFTRPIGPDLHAKLQAKFGTTPTDTVWDVASKISKVHPCFRLTAFF